MQRAMQYATGAEKSFAKAAALAPQDEDVILSYASWLVEQGNSSRAQQLVNTLDTSSIIHKARFLVVKGDISVSLQQAVAAYDLYTQAVQGSYTELSTIYKLAQLSRDIKRENDTTALLKTLIKRHPKRVFLVEVLSEHLLEIGAHEEAIFYYSQLLTSPLPVIKQSIALNNLAYLYTQTAQYGLAIEHARQAVQLRGDIPSFYDTLGWALTLSGDYSQGREYLEHALSMAGDSAEIQAHLNYTLDKLGLAVLN
jgi:tetratricopeptide (TPR) repeat protein